MSTMRIGSISKYRDELFGISILLIILFHFFETYVDFFSSNDDSSSIIALARYFNSYIGSIGVEVFVFLSGMGLYFSFSKNCDLKSFFRKRYARILIPYLYVGTAFWCLKDVVVTGADFRRVLSDLSFYTFFTEGVKTIWFILFLLIVYTLFPIFFRIIYKNDDNRTTSFFILLLIALFCPIMLSRLSPELYSNTQILITRIPLFIGGVYAGKMIKDNQRISQIAVVGIVLIALGLQYYSNKVGLISYIDRYISSIFSIALILIIVRFLELVDSKSAINKMFRFLGRHSLELYLLHVTMRNLMASIGRPLCEAYAYAIMVLFAVAVSPPLKKACQITEKILLKQ